MKTTFVKFASVAVVALALVQSLQASQITGTIGFTGRVGLNTSSASTASQVVTWVNPTVNGTSGSFTTVADGTAVTIATPWTFTSAAVAGFWSVGGFTFNLASSSIIAQGGSPGTSGYVNVSGNGTVTGNGYDATTILWNFSTQDPAIGAPNASFTFSASNVSVAPDAASTMMLMGSALTVLGLARRKLVA